MSQELVPLNEHMLNLYNKVLQDTQAVAVIFSSFDATEQAMRMLAEAEIKFKVMLGKYNNEYETSYAIPAANLAWLISSGLVDGQERLFLVTETEGAFCMYNQLDSNGQIRIEEAGNIACISKEDAATAPAFTFDPEEGLYYGTVYQKTA